MDKYFTDIIADELNVKEVKFADDVESFISYSFKPQLRTVGPKYGKLLGGIRAALAEINGNKAMNDQKANGVLVLDIDGNKVELTEEDLLIETAQTEGYVTESEGETAVVLDTNLTPELIEEGFVREIISKVQTMLFIDIPLFYITICLAINDFLRQNFRFDQPRLPSWSR